MFAWSAATHTLVAPAAAFAYLADPRHAPEWFARVRVEAAPSGPPRAGQTWRFVEGGERGGVSAKPLRMAVCEPPHRFTWETELPRWRTNLAWEMACLPDAEASGTTLQLTLRWRPGPIGWPVAFVAALLQERALAARTQRTIERARDAVEGAYPAPDRPPAEGRPAGKRRGGPPRARRSRHSGRA